MDSRWESARALVRVQTRSMGASRWREKSLGVLEQVSLYTLHLSLVARSGGLKGEKVLMKSVMSGQANRKEKQRRGDMAPKRVASDASIRRVHAEVNHERKRLKQEPAATPCPSTFPATRHTSHVQHGRTASGGVPRQKGKERAGKERAESRADEDGGSARDKWIDTLLRQPVGSREAERAMKEVVAHAWKHGNNMEEATSYGRACLDTIIRQLHDRTEFEARARLLEICLERQWKAHVAASRPEAIDGEDDERQAVEALPDQSDASPGQVMSERDLARLLTYALSSSTSPGWTTHHLLPDHGAGALEAAHHWNCRRRGWKERRLHSVTTQSWFASWPRRRKIVPLTPPRSVIRMCSCSVSCSLATRWNGWTWSDASTSAAVRTTQAQSHSSSSWSKTSSHCLASRPQQHHRIRSHSRRRQHFPRLPLAAHRARAPHRRPIADQTHPHHLCSERGPPISTHDMLVAHQTVVLCQMPSPITRSQS